MTDPNVPRLKRSELHAFQDQVKRILVGIFGDAYHDQASLAPNVTRDGMANFRDELLFILARHDDHLRFIMRSRHKYVVGNYPFDGRLSESDFTSAVAAASRELL